MVEQQKEGQIEDIKAKEEQIKDIKANKRILRVWDILLVILALTGASIGLYDLSHLKQIEHRCLNDCNAHWINEVNKLSLQCGAASNYNEELANNLIYGLNYTYPINERYNQT